MLKYSPAAQTDSL